MQFSLALAVSHLPKSHPHPLCGFMEEKVRCPFSSSPFLLAFVNQLPGFGQVLQGGHIPTTPMKTVKLEKDLIIPLKE